MKKVIKHQFETVLAIDTSCDDTCAAVVHGQQVLANVIASQVELHKQYGGVFPTVAKQAHKENIDSTIQLALKRAHLDWSSITRIAVTVGPGLAPALEVGIQKAVELGQKHNLPVLPVNHIEGHILSVLAHTKLRQPEISQQTKKTQALTLPELNKPILSIIVSGGHTLFVKVETAKHLPQRSVNHKLDRQPNLKLVSQNITSPALNSGRYQYTILGQTVDDAAGECLDKIGRMINLGYPAGPVMEQLAKTGDSQKYAFPLPMTDRSDFDLSFSGLKTHARNLTNKTWGQTAITRQEIADFSASAQYAVFHHICYKLNKLLQSESFGQVWLGGGVAANMTLRQMLRQTIRQNPQSVENLKLAVPYSKRLCGDNAAMIGLVATT